MVRGLSILIDESCFFVSQEGSWLPCQLVEFYFILFLGRIVGRIVLHLQANIKSPMPCQQKTWKEHIPTSYLVRWLSIKSSHMVRLVQKSYSSCIIGSYPPRNQRLRCLQGGLFQRGTQLLQSLFGVRCNVLIFEAVMQSSVISVYFKGVCIFRYPSLKLTLAPKNRPSQRKLHLPTSNHPFFLLSKIKGKNLLKQKKHMGILSFYLNHIKFHQFCWFPEDIFYHLLRCWGFWGLSHTVNPSVTRVIRLDVFQDLKKKPSETESATVNTWRYNWCPVILEVIFFFGFTLETWGCFELFFFPNCR